MSPALRERRIGSARKALNRTGRRTEKSQTAGRKIRRGNAAGIKDREQFDAIVTGVSDKGKGIRLMHSPVEGRLESGFEGMDVGHELRVQLVRTNVERGYIDFKRVM